MTRATTEKAFQQSVVDLARLLQWRVFYVRDSRGSPGGWPDLTLCKDRLLFRELKAERGRLSLEQEAWGELLTRAGCDWAVWRPPDWPAIEATLKGQLELGGAA
jgi:VRR-NUC domain